MKIKHLQWFALLCWLLLAVQPAFSQVVKGTVLDEQTKEGLIGASVYEKGTTNGTSTDFDGSFELSVKSFPAIIAFSYTGYEEKELTVNAPGQKIEMLLPEASAILETVEIVGQRITDKQKASPLTVESLDLLAIKQTASDNFYDGLGALKGVDLTAASLGFKIINMRGFNSTSPVRSLQLIDGVDNQAPGLNFSLGNFLGSSELDILGVELIQGASSAFYGPNAFNGVISMTTKSPFLHRGLSVMLKTGERNLHHTSIRWADALNNKAGLPFFGYKLNFQFFEADDWIANNYSPVDGSQVSPTNPGRYDAVNIYGDEFSPYNTSDTTYWDTPGLRTWFRSGYKEEDVVDYHTKNIKAGVEFRFRTNPEKDLESPELIFSSNFGNGTTVYQGDNRFSLRGILFYQQRLELRKANKWFIRLYTTSDDAGRSYDPYSTALKLQLLSKNDRNWAEDYRKHWNLNNVQRMVNNGYPDYGVQFDPITFVLTEFGVVNGTDTLRGDALYSAAYHWLSENEDSLAAWHLLSGDFANLANPTITETVDYFRPGSERFQAQLDSIRNAKGNREEGGTRFYDKSSLWHAQAERKFETKFFQNITTGASARLYTPKSQGTIFYDTAGTKITNYEYGFYVGADKELAGKKLRLSATIRADKNQNFKWIATPAASLVFKPKAGNFLRFSFSSAIRNPTLTDQYLYLNVGRAILAGNLEGVDDLVTPASFFDYLEHFLDTTRLVHFGIDPIRPEKVKTFEVGYRTTLFKSLYVDGGYYYNIYHDFLGYKIGLDLVLEPGTVFPDTRTQAYRYAANSNKRITSQGATIGLNYYFGDYFQIATNYNWNNLIINSDDGIVPAFNTPEHKFNLGFSGRDIPVALGGFKLRKFGFNVNYKWVQGFTFEGSPQFTGYIPDYGMLDFQLNIKVDKWNTTFKAGASNVLDNLHYETYGGPQIGRLGYIQIVYEWLKR